MFLCQACQVLMESQRKQCHKARSSLNNNSKPLKAPDPAYHILPNTLLVYQFIYIKTSRRSFLLYFMYKVNGGQCDCKDSEV